MSNKIVVGNRLILVENEQQQERKDNWHAIVTLCPDNKGSETIVTVKSMVRFLTKKFQDIGNFPEGMTLDEFYVYGEVFSSYDDENVVHKKTIRPGDKDVSGVIGVYETHMKFTFDHSEYATIDEMIERASNQNYVPVVDDRNVFIGIITRRDIINAFRRQQDQQANQNEGIKVQTERIMHVV